MKQRQYRERLKLPANAFAAKVGVTPSAISRYEAGRMPDIRALIKIYNATDGQVTPNDYFMDIVQGCAGK